MTNIETGQLDEFKEDILGAVRDGFQGVQEQFDALGSKVDGIENSVDHIANRADALWTENGAQVISNRNFEARIARIEQAFELQPLETSIAA